MKAIVLSILLLCLGKPAKAEANDLILHSANTELRSDMSGSLTLELGPKKRKHFKQCKKKRKHGVGTSKADRKRAKNRAKGSKCGDRRNRRVRNRH